LGWDGVKAAVDEISNTSSWLPFVTAIILMPIGWSIEALKWKIALKGIEVISFTRAFRSVWYGVVTGLLTPNRIGEPLGRMAFVSSINRGKSALLVLWCGVSLQAATLMFGLLGIVICASSGQTFSFFTIDHSSVFYMVSAVTFFFIVTLFNLRWISRFTQFFGFIKHALAGESMDLDPSVQETFSILLLSLLRYAVFSTPMLLMFHSFGIDPPLVLLFSAIFLTYLFTSFIPTFVFSEAGVRAGFAILFIGVFTTNTPAIISSIFLIWALNVALPALIAAWFPWSKNA